MLQVRKNRNWDLNLAAAKKDKTGWALQQTILVVLWLPLSKPTADPRRSAAENDEGWPTHDPGAGSPWGLGARIRKPKRPRVAKRYKYAIGRNKKSAKYRNASQVFQQTAAYKALCLLSTTTKSCRGFSLLSEQLPPKNVGLSDEVVGKVG